MPRATKSDKFFYCLPKKSGRLKGKILLGINHTYPWNGKEPSLQELLDFLKDIGISPSNINLPRGFMTITTAKQ